MNNLQSKDLVIKIVKALDEKKAQDIKVLTVEGLTSITDYFVICTGSSTTQIKAVADFALEKCKEDGIIPKHIEGYRDANWILLDFGDVVVHVFHSEMRGFYSLERLWADAPVMDIEEYIKYYFGK